MESREVFVQKQAILLELEQAAEDERSVKDRVTLLDCSLLEPITRSSLGKVLTFQSNNQSEKLDDQKIFAGDIIIIGKKISTHSFSTYFSGFVVQIDSEKLSILIHRGHSLPSSPSYVLQKEPDGASHRRLRGILNHLTFPIRPSDCDLDRFFLGEMPIPARREPIQTLTFHNQKLNQEQRDAVKFALAQDKMAFIVGPPGTGKTTIIVEILYQLRREKKSVLVTTPCVAALDNILGKLSQDWYDGRQEIIRLGHPGRAEADFVPLTLENIQEKMCGPNDHKPKEWTHIRKPLSDEEKNREMDNINVRVTKLEEAIRTAGMGSNYCPLIPRATPFSPKRYWGSLLSKMQRIFRSRSMVFSTVFGAARDGPLSFRIDNDTNKQFDVLIIDESSQAAEIASHIPMQMAKKVIIVGDLKGLPPTILSKSESSKELKKTIMQRSWESRLFKDLFVQLTTQYRMNQGILQWPSTTFYDNTIVADESIKNAKLDDISSLEQYPALVLIDTKNAGMSEFHSDDEFLCSNVNEVKIVTDYVHFLRKNGVTENAIGIITPYKMQAKLIKNAISFLKNLTVCDPEGLQGREKEVIILSLVRSNDVGDVGVLDELPLINVAITRAKRHLAIVCDTDTIASHEILKNLVSYLYENAKVLPAEKLQESLSEMGKA